MLEDSTRVMNISDLQTKYPNISWTEFIDGLLTPYQVVASDLVVVNSPTYLTPFFDLVSKTPKRVLANYVMWRTALVSVRINL